MTYLGQAEAPLKGSKDYKTLIRKMRDSFTVTKGRCLSPTNRDYKYYGGRGITVCQRWLDSFDHLVEDMGLRPDGCTLDRIDNDKGYSPDNCRWASRKEQSGNRSITITLTVGGVTKTLVEWAKDTGIAYSTLKARKQRLNYTDEECLAKEVKCGGLLEGREYAPIKRRAMKGLVARGFESKLTALNKEQVAEIDKLLAMRVPKTAIAKQFGVCTHTITFVQTKTGAYSAD